ncbi:MAG: alpha/beta fold hydrolase [Planctomycetia bacterium]|nr:alpha/beta fold hydrolase [Planctomycetia bacterium]
MYASTVVGRLAVLCLALGITSPIGAAEPDGESATAGVGIWEGTLDVGAAKLRLAFHFERDGDGIWTGKMDSPDQGALGLPLDTVVWKDGAVECGMQAIRGGFKGKLDADGQQLTGEWSQAGQSFPLVLKRVKEVTKVERPQEPKPPFPYREEEVAFDGASDGIHLAGTLTLPPGDGPFATAILISGSGQQDRNETVFNHKPFLILADALARRGIAVLRVDDRGVGGSSGEVAKATTLDFADDVRAELKYLQGRAEIDSRRIGLIGHSEGGLIAPMVAAGNSDVAFVVLLAAPGVTGEETVYRQSELISRAMGADDAAIAQNRLLQELFFGILREGLDEQATEAKLEAKLRDFVKETFAKLPEAERAKLDTQQEFLNQQIKVVQSPWFRFFFAHDPRTALSKLRCPVLALNGEKDVQVDPKQNLPELEKALAAAKNDDVTLREMKGLNHLFQTCKTGALSEYAQLTETFSPAALELIGDWVVERTKR